MDWEKRTKREIRDHPYARRQETTHGDQLKSGNETNIAKTIPVSGIVEFPEESPAVKCTFLVLVHDLECCPSKCRTSAE